MRLSRIGTWALASAGVEPQEAGPVGWMTVHSLTLGFATVYFETAAFALFLEGLGAAMLPAMYVVSALVCLILGALLKQLETRLAFSTLMRGSLLVLVVSTAFWRGGLALAEGAAVIFMLCVWYGVVSMLADFEYWAVASRLFDVRQAKRLFGLIGIGEPIARIVGAFSVPLLLGFVGVADLLWLALAAFAASLLVLQRALPTEGRRRSGAGDDTRPESRAAARQALRGRYARAILWLAALGLLGKYLVDFAFYEQARLRYADAVSLAAFFGFFGGLAQLASVAARAFLSGRVLRLWGVAGSLMVLPATQLACVVGVLGASVLGLSPLVFWLTVANQALYKTLKHPIDIPAFKVLYQPLAPSLRLAAQTLVDGILTPAVVGVAGVVMWLMSASRPASSGAMGLVMVAVFAPWMALAWRTGKEYARAVLGALHVGLARGTPLDPEDALQVAALRRLMRTGSPRQALSALELLERHAPRVAEDGIGWLLRHRSAEVRRAALRRVELRGLSSWTPMLRSSVGDERDPEALAAMLRCVAVFEGKRAAKLMRPFRDHQDARVRRAALIGLLRARDERAFESLRAMASSPDALVRIEAAVTVGEGRLLEHTALLVPLLVHSNPSVRRAAIAAAGRVRSSQLVPALVAAVADRRVRRGATRALVATGDSSVDAVIDALERSADPATRSSLMRVLGRLRHPSGLEVLIRSLAQAAASERQAAVDALRHTGHRVGPTDPWLGAALNHELALIEECRGLVGVVACTGAWRLLVEAARGEVRRARGRILDILSLIHDRRSIGSVRRSLTDRAGDQRALALEALEVLAEPGVRSAVAGAFEDGELSRPGGAPGVDEMVKAARVIAASGAGTPHPWTVVVSLVALAEAGEDVSDLATQAYARHAESPLLRAAERRLRERATAQDRRRKEGRDSMDTIERVVYLKGVPMFSEASEDVLADVAESVREVDYPAGAVVIREGDEGDSVFIVVSGSVRAHVGGRDLAELGPHAVFGEMALIEREPRLATVTTLAPTRLLQLDRAAFEELIEDHIEIVRGTLRVLSERLRRTGAGLLGIDLVGGQGHNG